MNQEQRAALRKLAEEATPGPWIGCGPSFGEALPKYLNEVVIDREGDEDDCYQICQAPFGLDDKFSADFAHIAAANPSTILQLLDYIETLEKDAARIDFIEQEAAASRSGVNFDYARLVEDGYVTERGFRMCKFHKLGERHKTLRAAIDAAMQGETE